jgi:hypothetical protein
VSQIDEEEVSHKSFKMNDHEEEYMDQPSEMKENINDVNIPKKKGKKNKKQGLKVRGTWDNMETNNQTNSENQSKIHKIENDIEEYLNNQTSSSIKFGKVSQRKRKSKTKNKMKSKARIKTDLEASQEQTLVPRFGQKSTEESPTENRLSIFKRFGASKRKSSKKNFKKKEHLTTVSEAELYHPEEQLSPYVIRGKEEA